MNLNQPNLSQDTNNNDKTSVCLTSFVMSKLLRMAASSIIDVYSKLSDTLFEGSKSVEENSILQVLMDILVSEDIFQRNNVSILELKKCCQKWESNLDPVNAHLMVPILQKAAISSSSHSFLILPGQCKPNKTTVKFEYSKNSDGYLNIEPDSKINRGNNNSSNEYSNYNKNNNHSYDYHKTINTASFPIEISILTRNKNFNDIVLFLK